MAETELLEKPRTADAGHGGGGGGHASHGKKHGGGGHGGGHEEAHEGAPEWLISFADNVMLQMGFFVILFAISMKTAHGGGGGESKETKEAGAPSAEALDFALSIREAFNNPVSMGSSDPNDHWLVYRLRSKSQGLSDAKQNGLQGSDHDVQSIRQSGLFGEGGGILFDTDSGTLDDRGKAGAAELAAHFKGWKCALDVRGHCSAAEAFARGDRGMQLSYDRAFAVAQALVAGGLSWDQVRITACADGDRLTPKAYDNDAQRSNQRVEVAEINPAGLPPK